MSLSEGDVAAWTSQAKDFRRQILKVLNRSGSGHPGGSLSAVEIFITLYSHVMKHNPKKPDWDERDLLIVSKGHISPVTYVTLAHYGYFDPAELQNFRKFGSILQGHVHQKVPGVEFNTGSLGHGLSVANGLALGSTLQGKSQNVFCLMGDGEIQEGSVWEAAMTAAHMNIDNVCAIIDYNKVQENGLTEDIKSLEPLADKWRAFGWETVEVDGHNFDELLKAFDQFKKTKGKPFALIAHTLKGKGVSFMELNKNWHGKTPDDEKLAAALKELA